MTILKTLYFGKVSHIDNNVVKTILVHTDPRKQLKTLVTSGVGAESRGNVIVKFLYGYNAVFCKPIK